MNQVQFEHQKEQMEAARAEFDSFFKQVQFHMPDTFCHLSDKMTWVEIVAWGAFLKGKGLK